MSGNGRFIVSGCAYGNNGMLKVWDVASKTEHLTLSGHGGWVLSCAVSGDGRIIASASANCSLYVWDVVSGTKRLTLSASLPWDEDLLPIGCCAVSDDGNVIVTGSHREYMLKVWDAATGTERLTLSGHRSEVRDCVMSKDGSVIVSASGDRTLKVWDATTGEERLTLRGHTAAVFSCAMGSDVHFIISTSSDHTLKVWDIQTGQCLLTLPVDETQHGCAFHPDGEHLVVYGNYGISFLQLVK